MTSFIELLFLSTALAMDCFTVSIVSGVILKRRVWGVMLRMSVLFGLFQAFMPLGGWLCTSWFAVYMEAYDHWIAFGLLAFLGAKMIREAFSAEEHHHFDPSRLRVQLLLAIATSIDAMAVGISFACTGYNSVSSLGVPLAVIGIGSFFFGVLGNLLGVRFGGTISRRLKPELFGGLILIVIGAKVLLTHLAE